MDNCFKENVDWWKKFPKKLSVYAARVCVRTVGEG